MLIEEIDQAIVQARMDGRYGVGRMGLPLGANYMFVCNSKQGKPGWLFSIP